MEGITNIRVVPACVVALAFVPAGAAQADLRAVIYDLKGATIYSDICEDRRTGDHDGLRIYVRPRGATPRVLGQVSEGGLQPPEPATSRIERGRLIFRLQGDIPEDSFRGEVHQRYVVVRSEAKDAKPFRVPLRQGKPEFSRCKVYVYPQAKGA